MKKQVILRVNSEALYETVLDNSKANCVRRIETDIEDPITEWYWDALQYTESGHMNVSCIFTEIWSRLSTKTQVMTKRYMQQQSWLNGSLQKGKLVGKWKQERQREGILHLCHTLTSEAWGYLHTPVLSLWPNIANNSKDCQVGHWSHWNRPPLVHMLPFTQAYSNCQTHEN